MAHHSVFICNKNRSPVYWLFLSEDAPNPSQPGDAMTRLQSVDAHVSALGPVLPGGIRTLELTTCVIEQFVAPTGVIFVAKAAKGTPGLRAFLVECYRQYSRLVASNPLVNVLQRFRVPALDEALQAASRASLSGDAAR